MIPLITVSFIISVAALLTIFWPLLEFKPVMQRPRENLREFERLLFEKERYLNNLKDLELDRNMKKMTEADYVGLRNQLLAEAAIIYSKLDVVEKNPVFEKISKDVQKTEKEIA